MCGFQSYGLLQIGSRSSCSANTVNLVNIRDQYSVDALPAICHPYHVQEGQEDHVSPPFKPLRQLVSSFKPMQSMLTP